MFGNLDLFGHRFMTDRTAEMGDPPYHVLDITYAANDFQFLREDGDWLVSTDPDTRRRYPIRDGIPVMLETEAEILETSDWQAIMDRTDG